MKFCCLLCLKDLGLRVCAIRYVVSERDTMEFNGMGYTRMEDRMKHYKPKKHFLVRSHCIYPYCAQKGEHSVMTWACTLTLFSCTDFVPMHL